ncbi:hypothetical protein HTV45_29205 [Streptomyces sp. CHD11]|uniref:hypothetical protein n=1 Tax=Streptomyces sp. CHD11 TaxID=2741325 RepID=UPI001BFC92B2|nr:hypothetical protein [Streptomyces sp. CHD11]MBT3154901.1 hypothetical protein [Streptomyces sp. CHD11]
MALRLDGGGVLLVAVDALDHGDVVDRLGGEAGVARGHRLADGGEAGAGCQDLGADDVRVVGDALSRLDEGSGPVLEGGVGLTLPIDLAEVAAELSRGFLDGVASGDQSLSRGVQQRGVGGLHDVDHVVEVVALEARGAEVEASERGAPERVDHP